MITHDHAIIEPIADGAFDDTACAVGLSRSSPGNVTRTRYHTQQCESDPRREHIILLYWIFDASFFVVMRGTVFRSGQ